MFEVSVDYTFAAGHALRGYHGKCENVHGHNYKVRVIVEGEKLNNLGLLMDFVDLHAAVKTLVEKWDHRFLNDLAPFDQLNPSAENMARVFCEGVGPEVAKQGLRVRSVTVWETDTTSATYSPSADTV
jgi:6-pyruvoyltetrahydropterin/6-carboxytetrahydropterin synthase